MSSQDFFQTRSLDAEGVVEQVQPDEPVGFRLKYLGAGSVDKVEVDNGADEVILNSDAQNRTIDLSSNHGNFGKLVDTISGFDEWDAKILDALREYALGTNGALQAGTKSPTQTRYGETVYDLKVDTSINDRLATRLTFDRGFQQQEIKDKHKVHIQEIVYDIDFGTQKTNGFTITEVNDGVETVIFKDTPVDNSKTTVNFASGVGKITALEGRDLVIDMQDDGDMPDSGPYLRVIGERE